MSLPITPTVAEVLANISAGEGVNTAIASRTIGDVAPRTKVDVLLNRCNMTGDDGMVCSSEWTVEFTSDCGPGSIHPSEVPALIDTLTEMYRVYLDLTAGGDLG